MADIFLSYDHDDKSCAEAFASALAAHGWSVWWDRDIPAGREFRDVIEEQLHAAKCVIVLWSEHSVESQFVCSEASRAQSREVLLPVRIDDSQIPIGFDEIQTVSIPDCDPASPEFELLVRQIAERIRRPASLRVKRYPTRFWINLGLLAAGAGVAAYWLLAEVQPQVSRVAFGAAAVAAAALFAFGLFEVFKRRQSRRLTYALAAAIPVLGIGILATPNPVVLVRIAPGKNLFRLYARPRQDLVVSVLRNGTPVKTGPFQRFETIYLGRRGSETQAEIQRRNGDAEHQRQLREYMRSLDAKIAEADIQMWSDRWVERKVLWETPELRRADRIEVILQTKSGRTLFRQTVDRRPGVVIPTLFMERP